MCFLLYLVCPVRFKQILYPTGFDPLVYGVVDHDDRSQATGTETSADFQGKLPVIGRLANFYAEFLADRFQHLLAAPHITSCTEADPDGMDSAGCRGKKRVEGYHSGNLAVGDVKLIADMDQQFLGEVAQEVLGRLKDGNQGTSCTAIPFDDVVDYRNDILHIQSVYRKGGTVLFRCCDLCHIRSLIFVSYMRCSTVNILYVTYYHPKMDKSNAKQIY
jgi:hypothetical protein